MTSSRYLKTVIRTALITGFALGTAISGPALALLPDITVSASSVSALNDIYLLGPGDLITVDVFNVPEYSGEQRVLANGNINLPAVGQVSLSGLTLAQAELAISEKYRSEVRYPQITVNLLIPRQLRIALTGEIHVPGQYTLPVGGEGQFPSLIEAIRLAGGITQAANLKQVEIRRRVENGGTQRVVSDLSALLTQGDLTQDFPLRDGDSITIIEMDEIDVQMSRQIALSNIGPDEEEAISVAVVGEVFRPGTYNYASRSGSGQSITSNNATATSVQQPGRLTVTRALQLAGGVKPLANLRQIEVKRTTRLGESQTISLDLWQLVESGEREQDLILQEGDTIVVPTNLTASSEDIGLLTATNLSPDSIVVNVVGEVTSPGPVAVAASTTLNQAVLAAGGFNRRAKETVALIRLNPDGTVTQQSFEVDLAQGLNADGNPILQHNDIVVVDPNAAARLSDGLSNFLGPFLQILPFGNLF
ncbi:sugar ABC transporter substrate-binding protein [Leptolyngbyaceae cyanobacterium CCMR0082]|uniref:Sugar ABC transporter substrate-binding protein n=1 Tax=Adonisia turfae CCMR0082 TaxID=2304604 RepID=A0A6M0SBD8_9CYAN|nr:polysaccharide biosynthesis/export family protein [Adonisia turfae]NEZ65787.1 sugar ABC transporter substrate-binding protein [Adonisia turfae CCMR0082]